MASTIFPPIIEQFQFDTPDQILENLALPVASDWRDNSLQITLLDRESFYQIHVAYSEQEHDLQIPVEEALADIERYSDDEGKINVTAKGWFKNDSQNSDDLNFGIRSVKVTPEQLVEFISRLNEYSPLI